MARDTIECPEGYSQADAYERYIAENPLIDTEESLYRIEHLREIRESEDRELLNYIRNLVEPRTIEDPCYSMEEQGRMLNLLRSARREGREGETYLGMLSRYESHNPIVGDEFRTLQILKNLLSSRERAEGSRLQMTATEMADQQMTAMAVQQRMGRERDSVMRQMATEMNMTLESNQPRRRGEIPSDPYETPFMSGFHDGLNIIDRVVSRISSPRTYRFGLEFEAYRPEDSRMKMKGVNFGTDDSIEPPHNKEGFECRTSPLKFKDIHNLVIKLMEYLEKKKCGVNKSCGFHMHTSHPKFFDATYIKKLLMFWISIEDVIVSTQPRSRFNNTYCKRTLFQYIQDYDKEIPAAKDSLIREMRNKDRYSALNIASLEKHGTIEVRIHAGTIDPVKIINWMIFIKSIFDYVMNKYDPKVVKKLFDKEISDKKIVEVFKLLELPEEVINFYLSRINKFGWTRLKKQTKVAKECIEIQDEKIKTEKTLNKIRQQLSRRICVLRGDNHSIASMPSPSYDGLSDGGDQQGRE